MSIPFPGFVGPSYALENRYAAVERCINWYLTANESPGESKWRMALEPSPCNQQFSALPVPSPFNQRCRGLIEFRGNVFGVNGTVVFRLLPGGGMLNLGTVEDDGRPVCMVTNGNGQVFIASAGKGYLLQGGISAQIITPDFLGASYATAQDGYAIMVTPAPASGTGTPSGTNQFQISGSADAPTGDWAKWDAANVSLQIGQSDNLVAIISSREYLRLLGERRSQIYDNVGNNGIGGFPFQSYNETFIETGCAAAFSLMDLGDSLVWIGNDARGQRACWRDAAFQPQRISTFAVEQAWQSYPTVADCVAFPFIWNGHLQCQFTFPTAGKTWVYDATTSALLGRPIWSERNYTDGFGVQRARSEQFHCFAFGKHLVGSTGIDGNPGAIYQYADGDFDCGVDAIGAQIQQPVVSDRITPHIWKNKKRLVIHRIGFEVQVGVGAEGVGPNLAQGRVVAQSSTFPNGEAYRAVDGNTDGNFFDGSVSSTNGDVFAWWEVDLSVSAAIQFITIWNRTDGSQDRLNDYWVFVSDTPFLDADTPAILQARVGTWNNHQLSHPNPATTIPVGTQGRYVRVQLNTTNYLSLAEVQVFGLPADPQLLFRWSKDGGNTYGPENNIPVGAVGNYSQLVYWNRLGYARDWVFWLRATGAARRGVVNAELDLTEMSS